MGDVKLEAGAGCAELVFPDDMFPTDGFQGIHDAPHVRVVVLDCGMRVALSAMELVNIPDDAMEESRKIISEKTGTPFENVWIHATHAITTPHAPFDPSVPMGPMPGKGAAPGPKPGEKKGGPPMDPDGPRKRKLFIAAIRQAVTEAADQAAAGFQPAKLGVATGYCDVNTNRDVETPYGWWVGINRDGPSNKTASVVRLDKENGEPIAVLIDYGIKPCAIDNSEQKQNTRLISSDVPGLACTILEQKYQAPCLFFMSAAGDQVPKEQALVDVVNEDGTIGQKDLGVSKGLEIVDRLGKEMADAIEKIVSSAVCDEDAPVIKKENFSVEVPTKGRTPIELSKTASNDPDGGEAEVTGEIITIGDLALIAEKPEVNTQTEKELKEASPYANTLLISMVNGGMKYMPDQSSYDRATWESKSSMLMPGCAEKWVETATAELNKMKKGGM